MPHAYATIAAKALHLAARTRNKDRAKDLRHIAVDCDYANEGCANSMESVAHWLELDGELLDALEWDVWRAGQVADFEIGRAA